MVEAKGWIKLSRRFLDHRFWTKRRRFSPAEAILDILLRVNHAPARILVGTRFLTLFPGDLLTSQVELAKRWHWNRNTVHSFLKNLQQAKFLSFDAVKGVDNGYTKITFHDFECFPSTDDTDLDTETSIASGIDSASTEHRLSINKNEENEKKFKLVGKESSFIQETRSIEDIRENSGPENIARSNGKVVNLCEREMKAKKGVMVDDSLREFPGAKVVEEKPAPCEHCSGPIVDIIERTGQKVPSCHSCGRRVKSARAV